MTPQEKLNSAIKSIEALKLLYGDKLEGLSAKDKAILAASIIDAHKELLPPVIESNEKDKNLAHLVIESNGKDKSLMLPVEEIVTFIYSIYIPSHIRQRRIRRLSRGVVKQWREKYGLTIYYRPPTHSPSNTYGYYPEDFHLVREVLIDQGYLVALS